MIPFNKPFLTGKEMEYVRAAYDLGQLAGDGHFTRECHKWLERSLGCHRALLTHSCTAALEMAAILANIQPGDEIIMPSYTFVSTANAFVLRGGKPVFVDIRPDTLNIDETLIEDAITPRTKAIVPVHYAGVACEMDTIMEIARRHGLLVIEDAAQGMMARYKGKPLGTIGDLGCLSFHETKNIISGEGGALLINQESFVERAEIIREKGTNRSKFFRGQVDKYRWVDIGSSYLPGEITAAFLLAQLEESDSITERRLHIWDGYSRAFGASRRDAITPMPTPPDECTHNAHMYYILLQDLLHRSSFIESMKNSGISTVFHYMPLHASPAGERLGRAHGAMRVTEDISDRLIRLPLWLGLEPNQHMVIENVLAAVSTPHR